MNKTQKHSVADQIDLSECDSTKHDPCMAEHSDISTELNKLLEPHGFLFCKNLREGSFGHVVEAKCKADGKPYAIKILLLLNDKSAKRPKIELAFLNELKKSEQHQNVIEYCRSWIATVDKVENIVRLFIQMELCSKNLRAFIYENDMGGPKIIKVNGPPRFYQHVFPQILNGLIFIHDKIGWVHRGIHPGNILIANPNPEQIKDITVKIAGFGSARDIRSKLLEPLTATDGEELAPELFTTPDRKTPSYDYKDDLYSAGIVLYFLSRYLEEKTQWKDEIKAFKDGKRRSDVLCHKDDKHLVCLIQSLMEKRERRPTAKEALKIAKEFGESWEGVKPQKLVEFGEHPESMVDGSSDRRLIKEDTLNLSSLRATKEPQQKSARKAWKPTYTIVSEKNSASEHSTETTVPTSDLHSTQTSVPEKNFFVKEEAEIAWNRCYLTGNNVTLAGLKDAIKHCPNMKPDPKKLVQITTRTDGSEIQINVNSDKDVKKMFQSAEEEGIKVYIVVLDETRPDMYA